MEVIRTEPTEDCSPQDSQRHTSSPGISILSRFPFMRPTEENKRQGFDEDKSFIYSNASTTISQQHKNRRRRGSLRKVALLGRGAQRDYRENSPLAIDALHDVPLTPPQPHNNYGNEHDALGLKLANFHVLTPSLDGTGNSTSVTIDSSATDRYLDHSNKYTSTTDEEDLLHIPSPVAPSRTELLASSGSESYFGSRGVPKHRSSFQQAKSPLSYSGISTTTMPPPDSDWDYSETEWWGWVVLSVTWVVFVIGMGSCLDVWSWAWDVGKTPYAPPELEDDPTLPVVGYYPALIILTCVMAWVWVVVAWVGMKYFRHAKISGD